MLKVDFTQPLQRKGRTGTVAQQASQSVAAPLFWLPLRKGGLALSHRPRKAMMPALRKEGCTHVLTLLSAREGARDVEAAARAAKLEWVWFPLENAQPPPAERDDEARRTFHAVLAILEGGGRILVHCSAGIHRTGMFAYGLLRFGGQSAEEARRALHELRPLTGEGVGEERLRWGDRLASGASE